MNSTHTHRHLLLKKNTFICLIATLSCAAQSNNSQKNSMNNEMFSEYENVITLEKRNRRKFDNAVIADLDQDGFLDLLLTEHARRVELYWNNEGVFKKGDPFIFGDTHGIAVGDYDMDGRIDILVQPGGGDGKNPRKLNYFQVNKDRIIHGGDDFKHFESSRGRAVKLIDIDQNGSLDLLTSAFPTVKNLDKGNRLYRRDEQKNFKFINYLPHADRISMRTSLTDFNNDGLMDVIFHGGKRLVVVQAQTNGTYKDVTDTVFAGVTKINNTNSISEIDFDNDGDFDLFLTRSKLPFPSEIDYDEANQRFYFFARRKPFDFKLKVKGDLKIENLQMAFPNFDVYIGKNKSEWQRTEDKHGHHDLTLKSLENEGFPRDFFKKGLYIGYLGDGIWRVAGHTDSPTTAVIHNVIEKPEIIELKSMPAKLLENRDGKFFDVTNDLGIHIKEQTSSSAMGDFNNDGWADIFVVRFGNSASETKQILYLNQEGKTFIRSESHRIVTKELGATGMGADAFDYDKDGDLDIIYSNERGKWHLFTNNSTPNSNNYVEVNVGYSPTGKATAMGAILTFNACGNTYKRVVGQTSSSYSHSLNTYLHVGLGECKTIENTKITWTNGETITLDIKDLNKIYSVGKAKLND